MLYIKNLFLLLLFLGFFTACDTPVSKDKNQVPKPTTVNTMQEENVIPKINVKVPDDELIGRFVPSKHPNFTKIKTEHGSKPNMYLRKQAYAAFEDMYKAALKDGIKLKIVSATRPFHHQVSIWEAKWTGARLVDGKNLAANMPDKKARALEILKFSSMPGTSRHHWGTDIDLNNLNNPWFAQGEGLKIYTWLKDNAMAYGFCQVYTPKGTARPYGYEEEKWHWTYLPISLSLTEQYKARLKDENIAGFKGSEVAKDIGIVEKYVLGISKECL